MNAAEWQRKPWWRYWLADWTDWAWTAIWFTLNGALLVLWLGGWLNDYWSGFVSGGNCVLIVWGLWRIAARQRAHNALMRKMSRDHALKMGLYDRRMELYDEAFENHYSTDWLRMRGAYDY